MKTPPAVSYIAARRYVGPHSEKFSGLTKRQALEAMNPVELETRRIAYAIKDPRNARDIMLAAREMAALIPGDRAVLIPVPGSSGSIAANLALAQAIQRRKPTVSIMPLLRRIAPVQSSCLLGKQGFPRLTVAQHQIIRTASPLPAGLPLYFVDNVTTHGNTLRACARCFRGQGTGLVFGDAAPEVNP